MSRAAIDDVFFSTPRLTARRYRPSDVDAYLTMRNDAESLRFQPFRAPDKARFAMDYFAEMAARSPFDGEWFNMALMAEGASLLAGDIGIKHEGATCLVGYQIAHPFRRTGLALEAIAGLADWLANSSMAAPLLAEVEEDNAASRSLLQKAGFRHVGHWIDEGIIVHRFLKDPEGAS
jgi:RimJ/RimL family protein N-acetyltransferase